MNPDYCKSYAVYLFLTWCKRNDVTLLTLEKSPRAWLAKGGRVLCDTRCGKTHEGKIERLLRLANDQSFDGIVTFPNFLLAAKHIRPPFGDIPNVSKAREFVDDTLIDLFLNKASESAQSAVEEAWRTNTLPKLANPITPFRHNLPDKWDARFLSLAKCVSAWSKDPSTKCGAVIVDSEHRVISLGYNGFPQKMPDGEELYANREEKYQRVIHAEMNALLFAAGRDTAGCTLYTFPFITCDRCLVHMAQAGITRIVAPVATADQRTRWGAAFERTRKYAAEMDIELDELAFA